MKGDEERFWIREMFLNLGFFFFLGKNVDIVEKEFMGRMLREISIR